MIGWLRRLVGRPDVALIEAKYRRHDRNVAFIRETRAQVQRWREALAGDGTATGNPVRDMAAGSYKPERNREHPT